MNKSFFRIGKLSGKGAAALICFCLAAVAAAGVYTYNKSDIAVPEELSGADGAVLPENDEAVNAEAVQENIPEQLPVQDLMPDDAEQVYNNETVTESSEEPAAEETVPFESGTALTSGILVRPLDGEIICDYSDGELVKSETLDVWKTHDGIDIAGEIGESVRSAAEGTVTDIYSDPMWGNCISIAHEGGYESFYFGLGDDIDVAEGDTVNAGTEIGEVGNTAAAEAEEASHLHFALKKNGQWIDPAEKLSGLGS